VAQLRLDLGRGAYLHGNDSQQHDERIYSMRIDAGKRQVAKVQHRQVRHHAGPAKARTIDRTFFLDALF
jgi:hypothetical protein